MPVENWLIVPLRMVTFVCPPVRTPTESSCGSGQVCGPIPGPVIVRPPRSRVTLSALMTKASVVQVMSFARRKSVVTRWPHCAFCAAALIAGVGVGEPLEAGLTAADVEAVGEASAPGRAVWQARAATTSSAMPAARTRIFQSLYNGVARGFRRD